MYRWSKEAANKVTAPGKIASSWQQPTTEGVESEDKKLGAKYTEAEAQGMMMGLKREHKEALVEIQKLHEEEMFKVRGEKAVSVEYYVKKIEVRKCKISAFCGQHHSYQGREDF